MRFVLPSSDLEHVVVPEPSCFRVPFCYLPVVVPSSLGLVRCVILYLLKSFVMERILSSELSFFILLMSRLFLRFPSSFYKDRVVAFLVR